ncbi:MAG: L-histidine N(alpha)-methyltransferase [Gemmatimonadales bacterium]
MTFARLPRPERGPAPRRGRVAPLFGPAADRVSVLRCGLEEDAALEFARAAALGLADRPRWLPARYLYDAEGSRLFDRICDTPEYYLTRMEAELLDSSADLISRITGDRTLVDLGAGSARKTERLLEAYTRAYGAARYVPVDVSGDALLDTARALASRHPAVSIRGVHGTYDAAFPLLERLSPLMLLFLGSTIGNLNQTEAAMFWTQVRQALKPGDYVLLGVDLMKDRRIINAAYNDAAGWSAAFTKNIFARMNRELGSAIDLDAIDHEASHRSAWRRVEIFARMTRRQRIYLAPLELTLTLERGERVMTEISRKFELTDLDTYLRWFSLDVVRTLSDPEQWYALLLLRRIGGG